MIKQEYIIQHMGKPYTLYHGYLDAAHSEGLISIDTGLLEFISQENGCTAVVKATVITEKGTFSGLGEANTSERGPAKDAPVRMAETRAKRRALSDAVNAGSESDELDREIDLGATGVATGTPRPVSELHRKPPVEADAVGAPEEEPADNGHDEPLSNEQYVELQRLLDELYEDKSDAMDGHEWFEKEWGKWISELSVREAGKLLDTVNVRLAKKNQREGAEA